MSIPEVFDCIDCQNRRRKQAFRERVSLAHFLAKDVAQVLGADKDHPPKELWDFFPELFAVEREEAEEAQNGADMALYRARMIDFALRHNNSRKGAGVWKE